MRPRRTSTGRTQKKAQRPGHTKKKPRQRLLPGLFLLWPAGRRKLSSARGLTKVRKPWSDSTFCPITSHFLRVCGAGRRSHEKRRAASQAPAVSGAKHLRSASLRPSHNLRRPAFSGTCILRPLSIIQGRSVTADIGLIAQSTYTPPPSGSRSAWTTAA